MQTIYSYLINMKNQKNESFLKDEDIKLLKKQRLLFWLSIVSIAISLVILNLHYVVKINPEIKNYIALSSIVILLISIGLFIKMKMYSNIIIKNMEKY